MNIAATPHILTAAATRHTTKAYDPTRKIAPEVVEQLLQLLRLSPSSTNIQPWHFILAQSDEAKAQVASAAQGRFGFNAKLITDASHVLVFASLIHVDEAHIARIGAQEEADGRYARDPEAMKARAANGRRIFSGIHQYELRDEQHWLDKQVYLNLGQFLLGAGSLGVDATPIEGVDTLVLDREFDLNARGYSALFAVALGYRDEQGDFNKHLPKSRLPLDQIVTRL